MKIYNNNVVGGNGMGSYGVDSCIIVSNNNVDVEVSPIFEIDVKCI